MTLLTDIHFCLLLPHHLGVLRKWRHERQKLAQAFSISSNQSLSGVGPSLRGHSSLVCEHIVVMNKRDLVPEWGIEVRASLSSRQRAS